MNEEINTEGTLIWRHGEPIYTMNCDRQHGHATLEYKGSVFRVYSMAKELWSMQLKNGVFLVGVGNPFFHRAYRAELYKYVEMHEPTYEWLRDCFYKCGIHTSDLSTMFEMKGCTHISVGQDTWHLFLPDGRMITGLGDCSPDAPQMKAVRKRMKQYFFKSLMYYVTGLFDLLRPVEFETFD